MQQRKPRLGLRLQGKLGDWGVGGEGGEGEKGGKGGKAAGRKRLEDRELHGPPSHLTPRSLAFGTEKSDQIFGTCFCYLLCDFGQAKEPL